jgi:hypothetical protein
MATKKRPDVSFINPGATGTNKEKYKSAVQTISETSETKKDISSGPSLIAAVGAKYKQNPTAAIARFKKSFVDNNPTNTPISWRATGGNIAKSKTVSKVNKTY